MSEACYCALSTADKAREDARKKIWREPHPKLELLELYLGPRWAEPSVQLVIEYYEPLCEANREYGRLHRHWTGIFNPRQLALPFDPPLPNISDLAVARRKKTAQRSK